MKIKKLATAVVGALRGHTLPEGVAKAVEALEKELEKAGVDLDEDPIEEVTEAESDEETGDEGTGDDADASTDAPKTKKKKKAKKATT